MRGVLISKESESVELICKALNLARIINLKTLEEVHRFTFKDDDLVISALEDKEEAISLEEEINNRYRLICFYYDSSHFPFEKYSNTIFIPYPCIEETIREAIGRLGSFAKEIKTNFLIGSSVQMEKVRTAINRYAKASFSIHLSGSTGTGKNVAAKMLHDISGLKNKMVYVNCGSCSNIGLIESNFFGYAKGSFTGSTTSREGYLKTADKSTLFLDEIENMSHQMQELLLDTIESGIFKRVGSDTEINSDFRIITASNTPLDELVSTGKLRQDFYYRIAQREIHLPDLKDHKEDIPELVQFFERKHNIIRNRITNYAPLFEKSWPGNVRELFKVIGIMHEEIEDRNLY